jgi:murein L,D-transpeptidase YafK
MAHSSETETRSADLRKFGSRLARFQATFVSFLGLGLALPGGSLEAGASAETAAAPQSARASARAKTAILVDKKTNQLLLTAYEGGEYRTIKAFHATLGKVKGDKEEESDLKTPEGIYTFKSRLLPPSIKPKFGAMAFYMNYPNTYDQLAGRTGFDIMLHGTDTPQRLKEDYDSEGCVVVPNEQIREIDPHIRLGLTPILIFSELSPEYLKPGKDAKLPAFFDGWIRSWETQNIDAYIGHYHSDFVAQGRDLGQWKKYKSGLNSRYASIEIGPEDVVYYRHPKYSMITFTQNYRSRLRGGGWGHRSRGTKILYIGEESGQPKILAETFTQLMW